MSLAIRTDVEILMATGLTEREARIKKVGKDYYIHDLEDFKDNFEEYTSGYDLEEKYMLLDMILYSNNDTEYYTRVDFQEGDSYIVERVL